MSDYEIVSKINLFDHTINCAISSIEICKEQPQVIRDIVMVICLLHDAGKSPSVQRIPKINEAHDVLSMGFPKKLCKILTFLMNCKEAFLLRCLITITKIKTKNKQCIHLFWLLQM